MIYRPIFFNYMDDDGIVFKKEDFDMNDIKDKIEKGIFLGEFNTNNSIISLSKVSHIIEKVEIDDIGLITHVRILDTPEGKKVKNLIDNDVELFLSARYTGIKDGNGIKDMNLISFDFTSKNNYNSLLKRIKLNKKLKKIKKI